LRLRTDDTDDYRFILVINYNNLLLYARFVDILW